MASTEALSSNRRSKADRFSKSLEMLNVHPAVILGCDVARAAEKCLHIPDERSFREGDPDDFQQIAMEYCQAVRRQLVNRGILTQGWYDSLRQAVRRQLATLGLSGTPKNRWHDYLPKKATLRKNREIMEGIDVYRATQAFMMRRRVKIEPRNDDPPDFSKNVALTKQVMLNEDLERLKHDLNNLLCILISYLPFISALCPPLDVASEQIRQLIYLNKYMTPGCATEFCEKAKRVLAFLAWALKQTDDFKLSDDDQYVINEVSMAVERFNQMLEDFGQMLDGPKKFTSIALDDYLKKLPLTHRHYPSMNIEVDSRLEDNIDLCGMTDELDRVFDNLIKNAREAAREHPETLQVKIHAKPVSVKELEKMAAALDTEALYLLLHTKKTRPDAEVIQIRVSDSGPGIPPEHREHLFQPYFSTKGEGRGRGLDSVFNIIKNHGGSIFVDHDETMPGACFSILLPGYRKK